MIFWPNSWKITQYFLKWGKNSLQINKIPLSWFRWRFTFIKTNHRVLPIEIFAQFLILRGQFFWCVKKRFFFVKKTQRTAKMIYWPSKPIDFLSFRSQNKMYRFLRLFRDVKAFLSFFYAQNYLKNSKFSNFFWY